jgi:hypothetical protein
MGRFIKLILVVAALAVVVGGVLYFIVHRDEHLIAGVPYWGIYTGSELSSAQAFAVQTILQYWGDDRFTATDISLAFPSEFWNQTSTTSMSDFFIENGYEVTSVPHTDPRDLKEFIDNDIPVISVLLLTPNYENKSIGMDRVVIGYSDREQKVIVHDNQFGNNYEISYDDYATMRNGFSAALVVKPSPALAATLTPPDRSQPYPPRSTAMNSESTQRITIGWVEIGVLRQQIDESLVAADMARVWESILAEPDFSTLHPAAQMYAPFMLARLYTKYLEKHQEAITLLDDKVIPLLETDFSEPYGDWGRTIPKEIYEWPLWTSQPFVLLGLANERLGDLDAARDAYQKAVEANPTDQDAQSRLLMSQLGQPTI